MIPSEDFIDVLLASDDINPNDHHDDSDDHDDLDDHGDPDDHDEGGTNGRG